jgi:hypothetical protein
MLSVRYLSPVPSVGVPDGGFRSGERANGRVPYRRTDCPLRAVRFSFSCCPGLAGSADSPGKFGWPGPDRGFARVRQGAGGEVGQADGRGRFFRRRRSAGAGAPQAEKRRCRTPVPRLCGGKGRADCAFGKGFAGRPMVGDPESRPCRNGDGREERNRPAALIAAGRFVLQGPQDYSLGTSMK